MLPLGTGPLPQRRSGRGGERGALGSGDTRAVARRPAERGRLRGAGRSTARLVGFDRGGADGWVALARRSRWPGLHARGGNGAAYGFPTWSPDGSQIAAVRSTRTKATVVVFDLERSELLMPVAPRVIFENPTVAPFYLSWAPDGKVVSFLGTEADDISLRIAAADGSTPVDGSGPALASARDPRSTTTGSTRTTCSRTSGRAPRRSSARSTPPGPRPRRASPDPERSAPPM